MDATVTVAQGIIHKDGAKEAPVAVVGFQMPMTAFEKMVQNITSYSFDSSLKCDGREIQCYLLDQNGYVVLCNTETRYQDAGKFMGIVDGAVMESMIKQELYKAVSIYDYQAHCPNVVSSILRRER